MAKSGHRTLSQIQVYTEEVDRKKLAETGHKKRIKNNELANLATPHLQTNTKKGGK